jgi:predicted kinase
LFRRLDEARRPVLKNGPDGGYLAAARIPEMNANQERAGEILILTGAPGAGKSTIANELAASWPTPAVHLHSDDFWHSIKRGWIAPYLPESHAQNVVVIGAVFAAARVYSSGGYFVVVDGILGPGVLGRTRASRDAGIHYVGAST